uniref:DUF5741 domain-containing protein n=1 Tax=Echinostoma caproni TaxID=27848 RepID=A0A183ASG2_9TREM
LSVEVEALEQLRAELEDSESMSEVHIQLERATLENKRLQSAIRSAHEQVSELYFSKRVLEAEMSALRSERDRQLAEANERVRLAERAVVAAATSRRRFTEPIVTKSPVLTNRSGAHSGTGSLTESATASVLSSRTEEGIELVHRSGTADSTKTAEDGPTTVIATGSLVSKPQVTKLRQPLMGFKIASQQVKDGNRFKHYATLTAMAFDEFDSLDEDDVVDPDSDEGVEEEEEVNTPRNPTKPTVSQTDLDDVDQSSNPAEPIDEVSNPESHSSSVFPSPSPPPPLSSPPPLPAHMSSMHVEDSQVHCKVIEVHARDEVTPLKSDTTVQTSPLDESKLLVVLQPGSTSLEPDPLPSPSSSSTPRKTPLVQSTESVDQAITPLLKDLSTDWHTAIVPTDSDTVPRSDYLRLLDEFDAIRQELEQARRHQIVSPTAAASSNTTSTPIRPSPVISTSAERIWTELSLTS